MASLPTDGNSEGTWGAEMNSYLLVSHNADGTLQLVGNESDGQSTPTTTGFQYFDRDGVSTKMYTKFITGNLDAGASDTIAHGLGDSDDIMSITAMIKADSGSYVVSGHRDPVSTSISFSYSYDSTNITIANRGTSVDGANKFRIKIEYVG